MFPFGDRQIGRSLLFLFGCSDSVKETLDIETNVDDHSFNDTSVYNVAFVIMDGTFNTELTAPMDIFHHTKFRDGIKPMRVLCMRIGILT